MTVAATSATSTTTSSTTSASSSSSSTLKSNEFLGILISQLRAMLRLGSPPPGGWEPPIVPTVAMRDQGIADLAAAIERHRAHLHASGHQATRDRDRARREFQQIIQEAALERIRARYAGAAWEALVDRIAARDIDPYTAAAELLEPADSKQ